METGNEPVRDWLLKLTKDEMKSIGSDILAVQWAWPIGKTLVDSMGQGMWEVRSSLGEWIARIFFMESSRKGGQRPLKKSAWRKNGWPFI